MSVDHSTDADDLPALTPEARLREIAAIFAAGILRLAGRVALPPVTSSENPPELDGNPLKDRLDPRSVSTRVNASRFREESDR